MVVAAECIIVMGGTQLELWLGGVWWDNSLLTLLGCDGRQWDVISEWCMYV
jgi:hypothetical protein